MHSHKLYVSVKVIGHDPSEACLGAATAGETGQSAATGALVHGGRSHHGERRESQGGTRVGLLGRRWLHVQLVRVVGVVKMMVPPNRREGLLVVVGADRIEQLRQAETNFATRSI